MDNLSLHTERLVKSGAISSWFSHEDLIKCCVRFLLKNVCTLVLPLYLQCEAGLVAQLSTSRHIVAV